MSKPEIHRAIDESPVTWGDAMHAWAPPAYSALQDTAAAYHRTISAAQLADYVQRAAGIKTTVRVGEWLPRLLNRISKKSLQDRLPPLTALCVNDDGTVFDEYSSWLQLPGSEEPPASPDAHAAADRLLCYRRFAVDLPEDGGQPGPMPQVTYSAPPTRTARSSGATARRSAAARPKARGIDAAKARRKAEAEPPKVCASCFMQLPASGVCDNCG